MYNNQFSLRCPANLAFKIVSGAIPAINAMYGIVATLFRGPSSRRFVVLKAPRWKSAGSKKGVAIFPRAEEKTDWFVKENSLMWSSLQ